MYLIRLGQNGGVIIEKYEIKMGRCLDLKAKYRPNGTTDGAKNIIFGISVFEYPPDMTYVQIWGGRHFSPNPWGTPLGWILGVTSRCPKTDQSNTLYVFEGADSESEVGFLVSPMVRELWRKSPISGPLWTPFEGPYLLVGGRYGKTDFIFGISMVDSP